MRDLSELAALLQDLEPGSGALTFGIPRREMGPEGLRIFRREDLPDDAEDAISRTRDSFQWPEGPGVLFLDFDPGDGEAGLSAGDAAKILADAVPAFEMVELMFLPSGSSHVGLADGTDLTGRKGLHGYLMVADATDIHRAARVLHRRLWLAGHGRFLVSGNGTLLERGPIDTMVHQPERLVFALGAVLGEGLVQRRGDRQRLRAGRGPERRR